MALPTINYGGRIIPRRPILVDDFVLKDVFNAILPAILAAYPKDLTEDRVAHLFKYFAFAVSRFGTDGFSIARELENRGWQVSDELVQVFKDAPFVKHLQKNVAEWITSFKIEPLYLVGDTVKYSSTLGDYIGIIKESRSYDRHSHGTYALKVDDVVGGYVIAPWEICEKAIIECQEV